MLYHIDSIIDGKNYYISVNQSNDEWLDRKFPSMKYVALESISRMATVKDVGKISIDSFTDLKKIIRIMFASNADEVEVILDKIDELYHESKKELTIGVTIIYRTGHQIKFHTIKISMRNKKFLWINKKKFEAQMYNYVLYVR